MINYIIGLKNKTIFYACAGGIDLSISFFTFKPEEAARITDKTLAEKLIKSIFKKSKKFVDLNSSWTQANDFENTTSNFVINKGDLDIFTFKYLIEKV